MVRTNDPSRNRTYNQRIKNPIPGNDIISFPTEKPASEGTERQKKAGFCGTFAGHFSLTHAPAFEPGRRGLDFYPTPREAIEPFLDQCPIPTWMVIEPSAGDGAIVRSLCKRGHGVYAVEVQEDFVPALYDAGAHSVFPGDFFAIAQLLKPEAPFSIVGNPPFNLAQEFVRASLDMGAEFVAFLLRLGFLESVERRPFLRKHPPNGIFPLAKRPSFTGDGATDGQAYAWFVWSRVMKISVHGEDGPQPCAIMVL